MQVIDLRSDTVTQPTPAMRAAMAEAPVGDDVYGEDPTINQLQDMAAAMLGKEAALFVASGTMGNLAAILAHCGRGDEVILGSLAHTFLYEAGGTAALGGVHTYQLPNQPDGTLRLDDIESAIREDDPHNPITSLITLENTHNRCGGAVLTAEYTQMVGDLAKAHGLQLHIDGARIFNAAAALDVPVRALVEPADSVTFCLSKGLCAPVGSVLCGSEEFIYKAHRIRKQLGGGMRQAGILAAAGIVALEEMAPRIGEDHIRARALAEGLAQNPGLKIDLDAVKTNMVYGALADPIELTMADVAAQLRTLGVEIGGNGGRSFRLVTHYWIDDQAVETAIQAFGEVLAKA
jgi:threonine aldolase